MNREEVLQQHLPFVEAINTVRLYIHRLDMSKIKEMGEEGRYTLYEMERLVQELADEIRQYEQF